MLQKGKFKAVLFDLIGTLVNTTDPSEIFRRILDAYGVRVSVKNTSEAYRKNEKDFGVKEMVQSGSSFGLSGTKMLETLGVQRGTESLPRKTDELWWNYADIRVYPDVIETLPHLKSKGVRTGVVTNGYEKDFQLVLQRLALTDHFDIVVEIDSCNSAKPDSKIFLHAVSKLHVQPEEALYVGDSFQYDFEGAKAAGLKPLLVNRNERTTRKAGTINSLTEVLTYI
ncbi:MAG: HAD family hydrolase [Candidatus Bathyarchaeia archaeon]